MCHCAKPVSDGWRKFGVNIWLTDANLAEYTFQPPLPILHSYAKDAPELVVRQAQCKYDTWRQEIKAKEEENVDVDLSDVSYAYTPEHKLREFKRRKVDKEMNGRT